MRGNFCRYKKHSHTLCAGMKSGSCFGHVVRALSELVFSVLQEGHQGKKGLFGCQLLHRNHENGLNAVTIGFAGLHQNLFFFLRQAILAFAVDLVEESVNVAFELFSGRLVQLHFRSVFWVGFSFGRQV